MHRIDQKSGWAREMNVVFVNVDTVLKARQGNETAWEPKGQSPL